MAHARAVGLNEIVAIIDNGRDAPGTLLDDSSQEFKRRFAEADLILAKGQGDFETLSDEPHNIFFLFKTKCSVIAAMPGFRLVSTFWHGPKPGSRDHFHLLLRTNLTPMANLMRWLLTGYAVSFNRKHRLTENRVRPLCSLNSYAALLACRS